MASNLWGKGIGLVCFGFVSGIIVSSLNFPAKLSSSVSEDTPKHSVSTSPYTLQNLAGEKINYSVLSSTQNWDVLMPSGSDGKTVALGKNGEVKVVVIDDIHALHVLTHSGGSRLWEGRLIDIGHDGTVEVADISGGHCENFSH